MKKELRSLKRRFGDRRRTKIIQAVEVDKGSSSAKGKRKNSSSENKATKKTDSSGQIPLISSEPMPENAIVQITTEEKIFWRHQDNIANQPVIKSNTDLITYQQITSPKQKELTLLFSSGKAYPLAIDKISGYPTKNNIGSLVSNSATQNSAQVVNYLNLANQDEKSKSSLLLLTGGGYIKRISFKELDGLGNRGFQLIKLKNKDHLGYGLPIAENEEIAIATNGGRILRYQVTEDKIPTMGKSAQGTVGIKLRYGEKLIGCEKVDKQTILLLLSQFGYARLLPIKNIRKIRMGELGNQAFRFKNKEDKLLKIMVVDPKDKIILETNNNDRHIFDLSKLSTTNNNEKQIVKLAKYDQLSLAVKWWG